MMKTGLREITESQSVLRDISEMWRAMVAYVLMGHSTNVMWWLMSTKW